MRHATVKCTSVGGSHGKFVDEKPRCRHTSFHHGRAWLVGGDTTKAYELLRTRTYHSCTVRASSAAKIGPKQPPALPTCCALNDAAHPPSGMRGSAAHPRVTEPMARPRDGADRQKRRHPGASTQGQLGLGRGPPISGRRRRRQGAGPRESYKSGPARLVQFTKSPEPPGDDAYDPREPHPAHGAARANGDGAATNATGIARRHGGGQRVRRSRCAIRRFRSVPQVRSGRRHAAAQRRFKGGERGRGLRRRWHHTERFRSVGRLDLRLRGAAPGQEGRRRRRAAPRRYGARWRRRGACWRARGLPGSTAACRRPCTARRSSRASSSSRTVSSRLISHNLAAPSGCLTCAYLPPSPGRSRRW